jgi:hypothetical protein
MIKKRGAKKLPEDERRKRFQAVVAPATLSWLESQGEPAGRVVDRLVDNHRIKQDYDSEG